MQKHEFELKAMQEDATISEEIYGIIESHYMSSSANSVSEYIDRYFGHNNSPQNISERIAGLLVIDDYHTAELTTIPLIDCLLAFRIENSLLPVDSLRKLKAFSLRSKMIWFKTTLIAEHFNLSRSSTEALAFVLVSNKQDFLDLLS